MNPEPKSDEGFELADLPDQNHPLYKYFKQWREAVSRYADEEALCWHAFVAGAAVITASYDSALVRAGINIGIEEIASG